jgi:ADP-ribosylglycohydrolase
VFGNNSQKLRELVKASTRLTHTDPKAEFGALAVAMAAYLSSQRSNVTPQNYYFTLQNYINDVEFLKLIKPACDSVDCNIGTQSFAAQMGLGRGVSGYIYHTVPVVIHTWLRYQQNYPHAIEEIIRCGGDTDTTAAILRVSLERL